MIFGSKTLFAAGSLLGALPAVYAQTFTNCDPLKKECPANPALGTFASFNWTKEAADSQVWNQTLGKTNFAPEGALFTIARESDPAPTIQSIFYIFWGRVSIVMKASGGQGIVSSVVLESQDLDEIDWEWLGGNTTHVQSNFFGKGDTSSYDRGASHEVDNTLAEHNYTVVWTQQQTEWYIDNNLVRTLKFEDKVAKNTTTGDRYPQTPMSVKIGNWPGGDIKKNGQGVVDWAGGPVDYSKGPFVQTVKSVEVHDFTSGSQYTYGDRTGSFQSIKVAPGNSTIQNYLATPHGVHGRWGALPQGARIGIIIAAISVAAISVLLFTFCCIKNRREGRREKAIADAEWERSIAELQTYKRAMIAEEELHPRVGQNRF